MKPETIQRIGDKASQILEKHLTKRLVKMDLDGQVKVAQRLLTAAIRISGYAGKVQYRALLLKDFPGDLKALRDDGMTDEQIVGRYFGCKRFVKLWTDLELNEDNFRTLLNELPKESKDNAEVKVS